MTANPSPAHHHPDHQLRPPAWRCLRAADVWDQGGEPLSSWDDVWVRNAFALYQVLHQGKDPQKSDRLTALFQAHRLYCDESLPRWELEARLLSDEPFEQI